MSRIINSTCEISDIYVRSCLSYTHFLFGESILAEIIIPFLQNSKVFFFMRIDIHDNVQEPFDAKFNRDFDARVLHIS